MYHGNATPYWKMESCVLSNLPGLSHLLGEETRTALEASLVSSRPFQKTVLSGLSKVRLCILSFSH